MNLPEEIKKSLKEGKILFGQARTLLGVTDSAKQLETYHKMLEGKMSARELERVQQITKVQPYQRVVQKDPQLAVYEEELSRVLGTRVRIKDLNESGGTITIDYYSTEEMSGIIDKIKSIG